MLPRSQLTAARLPAAVDATLASRPGAATIGEAFARAGGAERAATLIEELARAAA
jgi:UDP:flavonoid glycosyltransferase YjiC (YdhE family)